ncbi:bifunctional DNA primase/polymerase [Streptomyces sp. ODS05-4]|uniref:bifunctional DNA primase/polymerase n=1 Tax=Streptomyces sp. ODS05-4 TaxID=2944939 RepID=UPI002108E68A|nr:bifunctional DNA primase/polymerase [Streptomyces sp. ODS05-4]
MTPEGQNVPRHGDDLPTPRRLSVPRQRDVALWFAGRGFPVHPLVPGRKTPAANCETCRNSCSTPERCACHLQGGWCHGFHCATVDPERIASWWSSEPRFGVGVATGPADLVVLDVDAHGAQVPERARLLPGIPIPPAVDLQGLTSGYDTLALLAAYRGRPDPAGDTGTLRVRTPSGGLHIWYRNSRPGTRFRSSVGSSTRTALAWQVDVRARRGYIVAPRTRVSAGVYTALGTAKEPAPLPEWLADELCRTGHAEDPPEAPSAVALGSAGKCRHYRGGGGDEVSEAAQAPLRALLEDVTACAAVPEGAAFTEKLNRAAWTAGGLVSAGRVDEETARRLLRQAADHARPRQRRRNESIINASLRAGTARPLRSEGSA